MMMTPSAGLFSAFGVFAAFDGRVGSLKAGITAMVVTAGSRRAQALIVTPTWAKMPGRQVMAC